MTTQPLKRKRKDSAIQQRLSQLEQKITLLETQINSIITVKNKKGHLKIPDITPDELQNELEILERNDTSY